MINHQILRSLGKQIPYKQYFREYLEGTTYRFSFYNKSHEKWFDRRLRLDVQINELQRRIQTGV